MRFTTANLSLSYNLQNFCPLHFRRKMSLANTQARVVDYVQRTTKEKAGYLASACLLFEAYHSLGCKQTERYPRRWYIIDARKACVRTWLVLCTPTGRYIYPPAAPTSAMFSTTNSIVVVSNSQKQSVSDAFSKCSAPSL